MSHPHPHTKPVNHPHLETSLAVLGLLVGLLLAAVGWVADLTHWDRIWPVARVVAGVILAVVVVAALAACQPRDTQPGPIEIAVETSAVKVVHP